MPKKSRKSSQCSPISEGDKDSCLSTDILKKIYNVFFDKQPKNMSVKKMKEEIVKQMEQMFNCNQEACLLKIDSLKYSLTPSEYDEMIDSFKPLMPQEWHKNKNTWLNTHNIDDVLEQYEGKHDWFKYMGAHPIDFDKEIDTPYQNPRHNNGILQLSSKKNKKTCVANELCNIDIKSLYQDQGYEVLGFVFNTDEHDKSGEHWFSMLVDFVGKTTSPQYKGPSILYYDSAGVKGGKILKEISALIQRIQEEFLSITGERMELAYNKQQHQFKNTECGVYCLYFLTSLLDGTSLQEYMELKPDDKYIEQYRDVYFNKV